MTEPIKLDERILHKARMRATRLIREHDLRVAHDPELVIESLGDELVMALSRDTFRDRLLSETQKLGTTVVVPWSCHVTVAIPNPWWRRWLGLPAKVVHQRASGTVKAWVQVEARAEHFASFPELPAHYPREFGGIVRLSTWSVGDAVEHGAQTYPERGVAERWE